MYPSVKKLWYPLPAQGNVVAPLRCQGRVCHILNVPDVQISGVESNQGFRTFQWRNDPRCAIFSGPCYRNAETRVQDCDSLQGQCGDEQVHCELTNIGGRHDGLQRAYQRLSRPCLITAKGRTTTRVLPARFTLESGYMKVMMIVGGREINTTRHAYDNLNYR